MAHIAAAGVEPSADLGLEGFGLGVWTWNTKAGLIVWSAELCEVYGLEPAARNATVNQFADFIHEEDRARVLNALSETLVKRSPRHEIRFRIVRPGGTIRHILSRSRLVLDVQGEPEALTGVDIDVTDEAGDAPSALRADHDAFSRSIIEASPDCLKVIDLQGNIVLLNEQGARLLEVDDVPALMGRAWSGLWPGDARGDVEAAVRDATAGEIRQFEAFCPTFAGTPKWWDVKVSPIHGHDGTVTSVLAVSRDITQRKAIEDALRRAKETFQHLVERSPFGVYVVDADFKLALVSDGAQKVFQNVRPLMGRDFAEVLRLLWPEPFADEVISIVRRTLETGESHHAPSMVEQRADTHAIESYDWKIERIHMPDGGFGLVCHFYDLSERQNYDVKLQAKEDELLFALEAAHAGMWRWDATDNTTEWDDRLIAQHGIDPQAPRTLNTWLAGVRPEDRQLLVAKLDAMMNAIGRNDWHAEFRVLHPEKGERWILSQGKAERDHQGRVSRMAGLSFDITDRKRDDERQQLLLHELNHRVKNTLAVVQGLASQTLRDGDDMSQARPSFIARLMSLAGAHDILMQQSWESAPLTEVVEHATRAYRNKGNDRFRIDGTDLRVSASFTLSLAMALHELGTNAVKYGALSNETGSVSVSWTHEEGMLTWTWTERGGPPVKPPMHKGFGTRLIERSFSGDVDCGVSLDYPPEGVVCRIVAKV
jgi:PAS domain S-box-containing protein